MNKIDEKLDELLDIQGEIVEVEKKLPSLIHSEPRGEEQNSDYKYSREVFYGLVERGQDAIENEVAGEATEVALPKSDNRPSHFETFRSSLGPDNRDGRKVRDQPIHPTVAAEIPILVWTIDS